ncbi:YSIRK-type signal peptide-containing protein [Staphylococcus simulans]|uniref:YSIRK-type signal peptide-containing protein n=1 Tax=Staphylococcus simulans TaxID=1286 RepID=UPI00076407EA|nr:YSIRK-type signal peptide-containing protein [Staphylococcus simulans]KXA46041.1 signal peptide protein, YSIRK family [Staphylococcus simulans]
MKKLDFLPNLRNRYSIRRFTVGTASILIGSLLFLGHSGEAKAAENINDNNTVVEASNDSSTTQQAPEENNKTSLEKTVDATQQQTDNKAQTQNALEEVKKQATTEITSLKNLNKEEVDSYTLEVQQADSESTVHAIVEKAKAAAQAVEQKEESIQTQKTENSKESTEVTVEKTKETPSTEAEPVKTEATVEKASEPVTENKEKAPESVVTPATEPAVEKAVETVTETPVLSTVQKVEKVKADLSNDYDSAKVDAVLAVIDTTDLTPEQLKSEVLRLLLEEASAQKDLFSPQATLPRTGEEASGYSTRAAVTARDIRKLDSAIASAEKLEPLNPDNPYDKIIQEKLNIAKSLKGDAAATQEQVQTATAELTAAVTQKGYQEALAKLQEVIKEAKAVDTTLYTPLSAQKFLEAISNGEASAAEPKSTATTLSKRANAIETAKDALILIPDKTELKKLIDRAAAITGLDYGISENAVLKDRLNFAKQVYEYGESSQAEVDQKAKDLLQILNFREYQEALNRLQAAIDDAKTINQSEYTPATATPFDSAIKAGEYLAANNVISVTALNTDVTIPSPEKFDAATKAIKDTKAQLERLADKTELNNAIQSAESVGQLNAADPEDKAVQDKLEAGKVVKEDPNATQDQVKTATNELNDAVKHKLYQDALDELNATIQDAEKVTKDAYTPNSVTPFDSSLTDGKTQAADTNATPETLKASSKATKDAKNALVPRADKATLNQSITTAEALQPLEAGDPEDDALKTALEAAKTVQGDLNIDQPAVNKAKTDLDNAIAAKNLQDELDKEDALDELRQTLEDAEAIDPAQFTTSSNKILTEAVTNAKTILGSPGSKTIAEIKAATNALVDAQGVLVPQADKTALKTAINTANGYNNLNPNNPVDKALQDKLAAANAVNTNGDATADQVKTATDDLNTAITAKKAQDDQIAKDAAAKKAALDALNDELNKVKALDKATYTPNTVTPLTEKQTAAQAIADAPDTKTTEEINAATKALKDAQNALVPKANKDDLNNSVKTAEALPLNPADTEDKAVQDALDKAKTVQADDNATQDAVNTAQTDLDNTVAAKKAQDAKDAAAKQAALDALNDELNKVKALDKATYTPNTVTPLTEKQTAAQAIADAPDTKTTEEINAATKALKDAKDALVPKADKTDLQKALDTAKAITGLEPTDKEDKAVQDAIDAAQTVNKDDNATPQQVADATKAINDAVATKAHQDALDQLNKALEDAAKLDKTDYTADSVKPFYTAVEAGKTAAGDNTSTVEALNNATKAVQDATAQLVPDKSKLDTAITEAKALEPLTDSNTDQLLKNVLNAAETVKNNPNATPEEIKTATWNLEDEINNKKAADAIEALKSAVNKAEQLNEAKYTPNTYEPLKTAMTEGQKIINNPPSADTPATLAKAKQIEELVNALKERADKTELGNALDKAIAYGDLNPNDAEDKALQDAVTAGQKVNGDGNATTEEVANAVKTINDAIAAKERQDAVDELTKAINDAKAVNKDDYKPNTVTPFETAVTAGETAKDDATKTVEEIKAATKAITDAKNALDKKTDKTELNTSVTTAENLGALDTNDKEDKAVQDALDKAKTVQADQNATQEAVNTAKTELDNALNAKKAQDTKEAVEKQNALDALKAELEKAKTVNKELYTTNSVKVLTDSETAGQNVVDNAAKKTTQEIEEATKALKDAQANLVSKADKTELVKALEKAKTLGDLVATDKEDKAVQDAVTAGEAVNEDHNVTQEQVAYATKAINDAIAAKERQDALDALTKAIKEANSVFKDEYKPNTVTPLEEAVKAGETARADATKTVEELKQAAQTITDAQNKLELKANKEELNKVVKTTETLELNPADKEDKAVQDALNTAKEVQADQNASQETVDKAKTNLENAVKAKTTQDKVDAFNKALDALKAELEKVKTIDKDFYTPNSVKPVTDAETAGQTIVNNSADKTVEEINKATQDLKEAQKHLVEKADKVELDKVIDTAENTELNVNDKEDKAVKDALDTAIKVQEDLNATQEEVDKAQSDLAKALETKATQDKADQVNAALEVLKKELEKVASIDKYAYTPNSVEPLTKAETTGQAIVKNSAGKTVEEINKATQDLKEAQKHLVEKADKVELDKVIDTAENTELNVNDKEDKAVQDALDKAIKVQEDFNATQEEVDKAQSDLAKALENKAAQDKADQEKVQAFNKALEALKVQLASSRTVVKDNFTPNSVAPFEDAQAVAQGIVNNPESVTVEQVVKATEVLKSTQSSLVTKADKSELEKVIETAEGLDLNVTDKEDKAVKDALDTAVTVEADQNATQESVDKAQSDLEKALETKAAQDKADAVAKAKADALAELEKALDKTETIDKSKYTPESVEKLDQAVVDGKVIVEKADNVSVQDIKEATKAVETALNGLEKVKASAKETGKTTDSTPNTAKSDTKSDVKAQDKQTSKATKATKEGTKAEATKAKAENAGKNKAKALPETGQDVSSIDPQYASLMFAIGGLMMFFRKRKNEDKDNTEK